MGHCYSETSLSLDLPLLNDSPSLHNGSSAAHDNAKLLKLLCSDEIWMLYHSARIQKTVIASRNNSKNRYIIKNIALRNDFVHNAAFSM